MQKYGLKNLDGITNTSVKDHVSAVIVSVLQAGAFFGALASALISGVYPLQQNHTGIRIVPLLAVNSSSWKEENPSRILCYLLSRCCEYFTVVSFVSSRRV